MIRLKIAEESNVWTLKTAYYHLIKGKQNTFVFCIWVLIEFCSIWLSVVVFL